MPGHRPAVLSAVLGCWVGIVMRAAPVVVVMMVLASAAGFYYSARNLGINTSTTDMLSLELPFRQTYEDYKQAFPQGVDNLILVIDAQTAELADDAAKVLATHLQAQEQLFESAYLPGGGAFFETHGLLYLELEKLEDLADNLARVQPFLARLWVDQSLRGLLLMLGRAVEAIQGGESVDLKPMLIRINTVLKAALEGRDYPLSWRELMLGGETRETDHRRFIVLQPRLDYGALFPAEPAMLAVRQAAQDLFDDTPGLRLRITGSVALAYEELQSVSRGAGRAGLLALAMVLVVLFIGLRSVRLVAATLLTLLSGLLLTTAFATATIGHLNLISVAFAVLYIGLGVDFAIHLCMRYRDAVRTHDQNRIALSIAVREVGPSLMLCAMTTAIGFYAFIPTAFAGVSELGLIAGSGMIISLLLSLTLLPALLHLWPLPSASRSPHNALIDALSEVPVRHAKSVRGIALGLALLALILLPQARFDYNPLHLQDQSTESVVTFKDLLAGSETPPWSLAILSADTATVRDTVSQLERLDQVGRVISLHSFIPTAQEAKLDVIQDIGFILGPGTRSLERKPAPAVEQQMQAIAALLWQLALYPPTATPWPQEITRLQDQLQALLQALQKPEGKTLLDRLESNLLASLPDSLQRLESALKAAPVTLDNLPEDLQQRWISADARYRIQVFPKQDLNDNAVLRRFVTQVRELAPQATDSPVIMLEAGNAVLGAFQQAFVTALLAIAALLLLMLRSLRDTFLVLLPLLLAGLLTGATAVVLDIDFNFANVIALPLLLGIGVDNGIHMIHRMRNGSLRRLLRASTARAMLYSALTTILSFGNLSFSPHQGTASMGQMLTIGVLLTLIATLIVLPALYVLGRPSFTPPHKEIGL